MHLIYLLYGKRSLQVDPKGVIGSFQEPCFHENSQAVIFVVVVIKKQL